MKNPENTIQIPGKPITNELLGVTYSPVKSLPHPGTLASMPSSMIENLELGLLSRTLLPPTLTAILESPEKSKLSNKPKKQQKSEKCDKLGPKLSINIFSLLQSKLKLDSNSFRYYYDLKLDFDDQYELILYIAFGNKISIIDAIEHDIKEEISEIAQEAHSGIKLPSQEFDIFHFGFGFTEQAFHDFISPAPKNSQSETLVKNMSIIKNIKTVRVFMIDENCTRRFNRPFKDAIVSVFNDLKKKKKNCKNSDVDSLSISDTTASNKNHPCSKKRKKLIVTETEIMNDHPKIVVMKSNHVNLNSKGWPNIKVNRLLPPIPFVTRCANDKIVVTSAVLINGKIDIKPDQFTYYYGLELDQSGRFTSNDLHMPYRLNHYITYDSHAIELAEKSMGKKIQEKANFNIYYFQTIFKKEIKSELPVNSGYIGNTGDSFFVPIGKIRTLNAYHVNVDPDTSRGTETSVQDDDETP